MWVELRLDDGWSVIQWQGISGKVYHDIKHTCGSFCISEDIPKECKCGQEIPDYVQGFLVLCRNRNTAEVQ